jgi:hypothetical protein
MLSDGRWFSCIVDDGPPKPWDNRLLGRPLLSRPSPDADGAAEDSRVLPVTLAVALVRFRALRTVTVAGMYVPLMAESGRGEARGGVEVGAGSLDRADCTRCSSRCILPIRPRIWTNDEELGTGPFSLRAVDMRRFAGVAIPLVRDVRGGRAE